MNIVIFFQNMPKTRKDSLEYDTSTHKGREGLSSLRNRAADRIVKSVKKYQATSQHKVRLSSEINFR